MKDVDGPSAPVKVADQPVALGDFKSFATWLALFYGAVAGITVLFPLASDLVGVLEGLRHLPEDYVKTLASVVGLFTIVATFSVRDDLLDKAQHSVSRLRARIYLVVGLVAYILVGALYLMQEADFASFSVPHVPRNWDAENEQTKWLSSSDMEMALDMLMAIGYVATIGCFTKAFINLALIEYVRSLVENRKVSTTARDAGAPTVEGRRVAR